MSGDVGHIDWLGFIVFGIIFGSLLFIVLAATFARPWQPRVTVIVLGSLFTLSVFSIAGAWVAGHLISLLMG